MNSSGTTLGGRYRLNHRVGAGGMGEVWEATDEVLGRTVAVKVMLAALLDEEGFDRRFLAEARSMASVAHPGIVAIHDFHSGADNAYLVMEFIAGEPLSRLLRRVGRLTPETTMDLIAQAAEALQAAHDRGIVHRDVKPANLLVRTDGSLVLTDFGIARSDGATVLTATNAVMGTPTYLAPEQVLGHPATPVSDVYALGLVAYECLAGRRPFEGESPFAVAIQRVHEAPTPLGADVPGPVLEVINRSLATDPAHRWRTAAEFAAAARWAAASSRSGLPTIPNEAGTPTITAPYPPPAAPVMPPPFGAIPPRPPFAPGRAAAPPTGLPVGPPALSGSEPSRRGRGRLVGAGLLVLALIAGGVWAANRDDGIDSNQASQTSDENPTPSADAQSTDEAIADPTTDSPTPAETKTDGPSFDQKIHFAGYSTCGKFYCPTASKCWGGMTVTAGIGTGRALTVIPCDEPHYWETFAGGLLPTPPATLSQRDLQKVAEVMEACSVTMLVSRAHHNPKAAAWQREAWAVQLTDKTWVFHCLAASPQGESTGTYFSVAALANG